MELAPALPQFDGADYRPSDHRRLSSQYARIFSLMADGQWRTLREIAELTGYPETSISAQLRHARKVRFGCNVLNREHLGNGLYSYQLVPTYEGRELVLRSATR